MAEYLVTWEINIFDAESPEEAAREALRIQRTPQSEATCFIVTDDDGKVSLIDLLND